MTTKVLTLSALVLAVPLATLAQAAASATTPAPELSPIEQTIREIKHPAPWMNWGGDFRLRNEYFNNLLTLNSEAKLHEQDYLRFRGRVWLTLAPEDYVQGLSLNTRLAAEPREWFKPAGYTPMKGRVGPDWTEGIIDTLNLKWKNIGGIPLSATVGRQDLLLGDGWLVGDGTPYDGSWTYYLDAARITYDLKDQHTTFDAIGIIQNSRDDAWLPPLSGDTQHRPETEQNEKGAIFQVANTSLSAANLTGYFIYKHDDRDTGPGLPLVKGRSVGDNADIYTLGGRVSGVFANNWKYSAEGAYQFGSKQDYAIQDAKNGYAGGSEDYRPISAFGVNSKLTYQFKDERNNQLGLGYEFLSGDDPKTGTDEMFDVLWGRWPRWSEIGLYSYAAETRVGQEANLHRIGPTWSLTPVKNLDTSLSYFVLLADQEVPTRQASTTLFSNHNTFRGHFLQAVLKYKFSAHLDGHLWAEFLFPGNYYANSEAISFLRAEVMFTF